MSIGSIKQQLAVLIGNRSFARGVAVLAGGTAFGQLITVAFAPVLTRVYTPQDFGLLAVYTAVISIGSVFATLQYHLAIPLPEERSTMANVLALSLIAVLSVGLLAAAAALLIGPEFCVLLNAEKLTPFIWLVPLGIMGIALYEVTSSYAIRQKAFSRIASTRLAQSVAQNGAQISAGFAGAGPLGLLLGQLLGQTLGSASLAALAWRKDGEILRRVRAAGVIAAARRYRRFPLFMSWAAILNTLSFQAPLLLLSSFFGGATVGLFALGQQVLLMPVVLLSKSASQVFYSTAVDAKREGRLAAEISRLFASLSRQALPLAFAMALAAPDIFAVFFGSEWRAAGVYCQWLSPWLLFAFLTLPLSPLVAILERQASGIIFQFVLLVGRGSTIVIGGLAQDAMLAIALFGVTSGILRAGFLIWLLRIGGVPIRVVAPGFLKELIVAAAVTCPMAIAKAVGLSDVIVVVIAAACGLLSIAWIAYRSESSAEIAPSALRLKPTDAERGK